jgi:hypothetical protein
VLKQPKTIEHLRGMSMTPIGGTPDDMRTMIADENARWGEVIRSGKISLD